MNNTLFERRSIRLKNYDYTQAGAYFITCCTYQHVCLFGEINEGKMHTNALGKIVEDEWIKTEKLRNHIALDRWVIMPNHFHGILWMSSGYNRSLVARTRGSFGNSPAGALSTIVRAFKAATTKQINRDNVLSKIQVWQRNYWEHVVRNEQDLNRIRTYIENNPLKWEIDALHPRQISILNSSD